MDMTKVGKIASGNVAHLCPDFCPSRHSCTWDEDCNDCRVTHPGGCEDCFKYRYSCKGHERYGGNTSDRGKPSDCYCEHFCRGICDEYSHLICAECSPADKANCQRCVNQAHCPNVRGARCGVKL